MVPQGKAKSLIEEWFALFFVQPNSLCCYMVVSPGTAGNASGKLTHPTAGCSVLVKLWVWEVELLIDFTPPLPAWPGCFLVGPPTVSLTAVWLSLPSALAWGCEYSGWLCVECLLCTRAFMCHFTWCSPPLQVADNVTVLLPQGENWKDLEPELQQQKLSRTGLPTALVAAMFSRWSVQFGPGWQPMSGHIETPAPGKRTQA